MAALGYCYAVVGQRVNMIVDWTTCPDGYNHDYWQSSSAYAAYKYNVISMILFNTNDWNTYYTAYNGESTDWWVYSERDAQGRYKFWPMLHPPSVSVTEVTPTTVTFSLSNNGYDTNGWLVYRWHGYTEFSSIEVDGVRATWTDTTVAPGTPYSYCVRAAFDADYWYGGLFATSGVCPDPLAYATTP